MAWLQLVQAINSKTKMDFQERGRDWRRWGDRQRARWIYAGFVFPRVSAALNLFFFFNLYFLQICFLKNSFFFFLCEPLLEISCQKMGFPGVDFRFLRCFMYLEFYCQEKFVSHVKKKISFAYYKLRMVLLCSWANLFWLLREETSQLPL